jgi:uncharacterized protein YdeI (YjbR/CyaY-like superfamily)
LICGMRGQTRMKPTFFDSSADFRDWLESHHAIATELWVGFHKKKSGKPSMTWPESVDQALCFGWIDGIRKSIDEASYVIRFSPRKPTSIWSAVNIRRAAELAAEGLMRPSGIKAYELRKENRSGIYSYEQRSHVLPEPYEKILKENKLAWDFFQSQPPSYRKLAVWWVVSAKKEETRLRRLDKLIQLSVQRKRLA